MIEMKQKEKKGFNYRKGVKAITCWLVEMGYRY